MMHSAILIFSLLFTYCVCQRAVIETEDVRWCTVGKAELEKCKALSSWITQNKNELLFQNTYPLKCVTSSDKFGCMTMVYDNQADLINVDSGLSYEAGKLHNLKPILFEKNQIGTTSPDGFVGLGYYSVAVVMADQAQNFKSLNDLHGVKSCHPGTGHGSGWTLPLAQLIRREVMKISECNVAVKSAAAYLGEMCAPGAMADDFNPYGDNPMTACDLCSGTDSRFCANGADPFSGNDGAIRCLLANPTGVAWVRDATIPTLTLNDSLTVAGRTYYSSDFRLFCPDGSTRPVDQYKSCHFGTVASDVIMTSILALPAKIAKMKELILNVVRQSVDEFRAFPDRQFPLFNSLPWCRQSDEPVADPVCQRNLLFTDGIEGVVATDEDYIQYLDRNDYSSHLAVLAACPIRPVRWCVISRREKLKCEQMKMNFGGRGLKPDLDCVMASGTVNCMKLIADGDADLANFDPGDAFVAGKEYDLVPISAEDYGDNQHSYYVVAVALKADLYSTIFNLKNRRACMSAAGTAAGWYVPVTSMIQSDMVRIFNCDISRALGSFFLRACIPGILDTRFNPSQTNPIELCGLCASGGHDKCQRDSRELYYGTTGAFRCLVEGQGDIAYMKHTTVLDNTDGRNPAFWSRNRRSDDYELLCLNGGRASVWGWNDCHLARVPSNVIMTANYKDPVQREIYWNLLNYAQSFFASDVDSDFNMFDSGFMDNDLMFSDSTVRLVYIPPEKQNYKLWLGQEFINTVNNLHNYECPDRQQYKTVAESAAPAHRFATLTVLTILAFGLGFYR